MRIVLRVIITVVCVISMIDGSRSCIFALRDHQIAEVAQGLLRGGSFPDDTLNGALSTADVADKSCKSRLSDLAIVRLSLLENASARLEISRADRELANLTTDNRALLSCEPTRSFNWLLQFWLGALSDLAAGLSWRYLEQSYETGLYEGWIAARRSRIAIAGFDFAPSQIQALTVREFKAFLRYNFIEDGVQLYASASASTKSALDEAVRMSEGTQRQSFARHLDARIATEPLIDTVGGSRRGSLLNGKTRP